MYMNTYTSNLFIKKILWFFKKKKKYSKKTSQFLVAKTKAYYLHIYIFTILCYFVIYQIKFHFYLIAIKLNVIL